MQHTKNTLQNAPENRTRRKAIKTIAVGAGVLSGYTLLPQKWTRPIVSQIVLPAHAQTSAVSTICNELDLTVLSGDQSSGAVSVRVAGCVIPPAENIPIIIFIQGAGLGLVRYIGPGKDEGMLEHAVAAVKDFFVGEALAADSYENITGYALTSADGIFYGDFDIPCGPKITSLSASAFISGMTAHSASGSVAIPEAPEPGSSSVEPPAPSATCCYDVCTPTSCYTECVHQDECAPQE